MWKIFGYSVRERRLAFGRFTLACSYSPYSLYKLSFSFLTPRKMQNLQSQGNPNISQSNIENQKTNGATRIFTSPKTHTYWSCVPASKIKVRTGFGHLWTDFWLLCKIWPSFRVARFPPSDVRMSSQKPCRLSLSSLQAVSNTDICLLAHAKAWLQDSSILSSFVSRANVFTSIYWHFENSRFRVFSHKWTAFESEFPRQCVFPLLKRTQQFSTSSNPADSQTNFR